MAVRVKVKTPKVVKATLANKDVIDMFQGMLGTSEETTNIGVAFSKYQRIRQHTERFVKLLSALQGSQIMKHFPDTGLSEYASSLKKQFDEVFTVTEQPVGSVAITAFNEVFKVAKKCNLTNIIIITCKNLISYKKYLQDQNALSDKFLLKTGGISFCPLEGLQLNFKQMYIDDRLSADDKNFLLVILHKMMTIGHDVYEALSAPDVDVDEFVGVIMTSLDEVKKHIPRCDQAFQKIADSVSLLKGNFGDYYKDYTASGNPTIIMENFVLDVSKNTNSSPQVTAQFRKIISHYRKLSSQQASNPKLKSLFAQVDANFQELERRSRAEGEIEEDPDEGLANDTVEGPVNDTDEGLVNGTVNNATTQPPKSLAEELNE